MKSISFLLLFIPSLVIGCEKTDSVPQDIYEISIDAPSSLEPETNTVFDNAFIALSWNTVTLASRYELWIDTVENSESPISKIVIENNSYTTGSLDNNEYYWKVRAGNDTLWGDWSATNMFYVNVDIAEKNVILNSDSKVVLLSGSQQYKFLEGPVWNGEKLLYFSDIHNDKINIYDTETGYFQTFRIFSNKTNGLMFNHANQLVACEGGSGKVVTIGATGLVDKVIASTYNDARFNAPNDLVIDTEGGIYFTDPTWGDQPQGLNGVYYIDPDGDITRLVDDLIKPNGLIFSPDESKLYINDSWGEHIRVYDIISQGKLSGTFESIKLNIIPGNISSADGMAMDIKGNLYVTTALGIQVFDKMLEYMLTIEVPEQPANCTFGGNNLKTLFITARTNLYSIELNIEGVTFPLD